MPYSEEMAKDLIGSAYVKLGKDLVPEDQKLVKNAFVNRFTAECRPSWTRKPRPDGSKYMVQFQSDQEWLNETWFATNKHGRWDVRFGMCACKPVFPHGDHEDEDGSGTR